MNDILIPYTKINSKEWKTMILTYISTPIFTEALFTIAKRYKHSKYLLLNEWKKMWYIDTMQYSDLK